MNNASSYEELQPLTFDTATVIEPFADFNSWFTSVIDEVQPSLIVGIARGAIRLLQLQNIDKKHPDISIISDHALPFISDSDIKARRVLLFDDSVIYGSTLSAIREYLLTRGAVVFCAAYVVDRFNFLGEPDPEDNSYAPRSKFRDIPIRAKHQLWPSAIRRHHNILIDSLLKTPRDYNIDFPAFSLKINEYSANEIPYILNLLNRSNVIRHLFDVSSTISAEGKIYRYTALLEPMVSHLFTKHRLFCRAYSKARITFIPENQEIRFTPMPQLSMNDELVFEDIKLIDHPLSRRWQKLHPPQHKDDFFYKQGVFRLSTVFTAVVMGEALVRHFVSALQREFPIHSIQLIDEDLKAIVGNENAISLQQVWSYLHNLELIPGLVRKPIDPFLDWSEYLNEKLIRAIIAEWVKQPWLKPLPGELAYEVLGKVFLSLRAVTDSKECRTENPYASRLEIGLSYEGIRRLLLDECGLDFTPDEISLALDMCVDNGQAVPKVIQQKSVWLRAFYSGEAEDSHKLFQLKDAIHKGYSEFIQQRGVKPLTQFDLHKLCATLKELFPWLPISTKFHTFGKYARVGRSDTEIIAWLVNQGSGPLQLVYENGKRVLQLNDEYKPCVNPTWGLKETRDFYDAFQYIATAFSHCKNDEAKLLLSTCLTHRHTYNAVAFEAHSWVQHGRGDFQTLLSGIQLTTNNTLENREQAVTSIYWCVRFISEALKKFDLFHNKFESLKLQVSDLFIAQGMAATRFWQFGIAEKNILDPSLNLEIELRFSYLMPLVSQMLGLTSFVTKILLDLGLLSESELREKFEGEGVSLKQKEFQWLLKKNAQAIANSYNVAIKDKKIAGLSIEKTLLPLDIPFPNEKIAPEWYQTTLARLKDCFTEIQTSLNLFCPEYEVTEGNFPYSPDTSKRTLTDGSNEIRLDDVYVLTIDIIGSTNSEQTNPFKDYIIQTFKRFQSKGVYFEITGNDAYVACCVDPLILWDIAKSISIQGEMLKGGGGRFGGTRKGLAYGAVSIVKHIDESMAIRDARMT